MSKKANPKIRMVIEMERSQVDKTSKKECVDNFVRTFDLMRDQVIVVYAEGIRRLKKTGRLSWPSKTFMLKKN